MSIDDGATTTRDDAPSENPDPSTDRAERSARWAAIAFAAYLVVAFFLILFVYGDGMWFWSDEWGMIVNRGFDVDGLFRPQNSHWSTFPVVVYQVLYRIFGLHTYVPYLIVVAGLHLTLAALLRVVMRRAGVGPWLATVAAGSFVLFGTGYQNILFGIQMSMVGSMVFGLAHLLLADHDGRADRRDAIGLGLGAVGVMASGVGPPMVMIVGLAVLIRRGWRAALLHTVPLGVLYLLWHLWQQDNMAQATEVPPIGDAVSWVQTGTYAVFMGLGQYQVVAILLAIMLVVGLVLAWTRLPWAELRVVAASPFALLVGGVVLYAIVSSQRWVFGVDQARTSRYVAMATALVLPAIAVAGAALIKRWRYTAPAVFLLFLIGVPGNLRAFDDSTFTDGFFAGQRRFVLGAAEDPILDEVSADALPDPNYFRTARVTAEFLRDARDAGRLPDAPPIDERTAAGIELRLKLSQTLDPLPAEAECEVYAEPQKVKLQRGDRLGIKGPISVSQPRPGKLRFKSTYDPLWAGNVLVAEVDDLVIFLEPVAPALQVEWCRLP
jgi:hypothetical protein